jgi:hypothetical protein
MNNVDSKYVYTGILRFISKKKLDMAVSIFRDNFDSSLVSNIHTMELNNEYIFNLGMEIKKLNSRDKNFLKNIQKFKNSLKKIITLSDSHFIKSVCNRKEMNIFQGNIIFNGQYKTCHLKKWGRTKGLNLSFKKSESEIKSIKEEIIDHWLNLNEKDFLEINRDTKINSWLQSLK